MDTAGLLLRREREKQQKSLEDIARTTKISISVLRAIEKDSDITLAPSYVKGFIKIYALELDLSPNELIELYEKNLQQVQLQASHKEEYSSKKNYAPTALVAVLIIFLILYLSYRLVQPQDKDAGTDVIPKTTTIISNAEQKKSQPDIRSEQDNPEDLHVTTTIFEPSSENVREGNLEQNERFTVRFVARDLTWVKITVDYEETYEIMLRAGESYGKTARESMKVRIGNAGGLSLYYNNRPLGVPGKQGKPVNLEFPEAAENLTRILR